MISLSTMWAKGRYTDLHAFAAQIKTWGFTHIEANSWLLPQMVEELFTLPLPISSIHAPCPNETVVGKPVSAMSLSSLSKEERSRAIYAAKKTIDLASKLGAKVVIIHLGEVPIAPDLQKRLHSYMCQTDIPSESFNALFQEIMVKRESKAPPFLAAATESLLELAQYCQHRDVTLGLETRFYPYEIPNIDEMAQLLALVGGYPVGYWHDVGHAQVQQYLGLATQKEWLDRFNYKMVGIHLHDVRGFRDHLPPGTGEVEWKLIASYLPDKVLRVCEIGEWNNEEDHIIQSIHFLRSRGIVFA